MNLDSIKIKMRLENLDFNYNQYDESIINRAGGGVITKYVLCREVINHVMGLSCIEILPTTNEVIVISSAKILREQYLEGINKNTLERFYSEIRKYISCSFSDIEHSLLCRADISENLYFETRVAKEHAIKSLRLGKSNTAFKVDDFTDKKESIIFIGRQISYKNRQIYYNKELELNMRNNEEILYVLQNNNVKGLEKILRVEQNISNFDKLRYAIGKSKGDVALGEMVSSNENPLLKRHQIIMKYAGEVTIFDEYSDWDDAMFNYGIEGIYIACNSDLNLVMDFLNERAGRRLITKRGNRVIKSGHYYELKKKIQTHFSNNIVCLTTNVSSNDSYLKSLKRIEELLKSV